MSGRAPSVDTEEPLLKRLKTKEEKNEQSRVRMARLRRREREIALDRVGVARYGMQLYSRANVVRVYCNIYIFATCVGVVYLVLLRQARGTFVVGVFKLRSY